MARNEVMTRWNPETNRSEDFLVVGGVAVEVTQMTPFLRQALVFATTRDNHGSWTCPATCQRRAVGFDVYVGSTCLGRIVAVTPGSPQTQVRLLDGSAIVVLEVSCPTDRENAIDLSTRTDSEIEDLRRRLEAAERQVAEAHRIPIRTFTDGGITLELDDEPDQPATVVPAVPMGEFNRIIDV